MENTIAVKSADKRKIKKVAVLGSGVMGSRLACHFANVGLNVVLLDIVPFDLDESQKDNPIARNKIVNDSLKATLKANPSPIYRKSFANRITTGNFTDDMHLIADCDWVLEAVIERLDIKKQVFENVEQHRKAGSLISSNTSGIPIQMMLAERSADFQAHFCGTHFFNPPRYLRLLEVIPTEKTHPEVTKFFMDYGSLFLGKTTVLAKDTPAFIANRVGVFSIMAIFHLMKEMGLTIEEVDSLTGPVTGRPKSATFRTCDVVGIDTLVKVANGVRDNCPDDEAKDLFAIPDYVTKMVEKGWTGDKGGQGFYKKSKDAEGKRLIEALNLETLEYAPKVKVKFASVGMARTEDDLKKRLKIFKKGTDKGAEFLRKLSHNLFEYASKRIPESADELYQIDDAMRTGFAWELGPFEQWDVVGVKETVEEMKAAGHEPAAWVTEMLAAENESFYKVIDGVRNFYDVASKSYKPVAGIENFIILDNLREQKAVWQNSGTTIHDLGDGVLNVEFHTKMNSIGGEVLEGINKGISLAEEEGWKGVVIGNDAPNFSAGANLAMILMFAIEQEWDELDFAIRAFQNTVTRCRFSSVPVVVGPHGLTLGGGCEMTMHSDAAVAAAETYIGLVEVGVGVIPGGGGTKEMVLRVSDGYYKGDPKLPPLQEAFINIATAKVATSAYEAFDIGVLNDKDSVVVNQSRVLLEAKQKVLELHNAGYTQPQMRTDIEVQGRSALGGLYAGAEAFYIGKYASEHDKLIAQKLAWVMAGGDLSMPTKVSEQYLLDLEREAFLTLCGTRKTLERIQSILTTGKPLRN